MKKTLYFNDKTKDYYVTGSKTCDLNGCELFESALIISKHHKHQKSSLKLLCYDCFRKLKQTDILYASEIKTVILVDEPPKNSFIVPLKRLRLSNNNSSTFDVATSNKHIMSKSDNSTVTDNTALAGKESWEGSQIGVDPERLPDKTKELSIDEADTLLDDLASAVPVIEHSDKKMLSSKPR